MFRMLTRLSFVTTMIGGTTSLVDNRNIAIPPAGSACREPLLWLPNRSSSPTESQPKGF
jgi:hypothetical protein